MTDPDPFPTGPHGPRTWPPSATPGQLAADIAADIAATPRAMPPRPVTGMPPLVQPRPLTDPVLVGTVHDSRRHNRKELT